MADLKKVYGAVNKEAALYALEEFKEKWDNPVRDWGKIIGQFMMFFEERFDAIRTA